MATSAEYNDLVAGCGCHLHPRDKVSSQGRQHGHEFWKTYGVFVEEERA